MTADSTEGDEAQRATKHGLFHELLKQNAIEIAMDTVIWRVYDETASYDTKMCCVWNPRTMESIRIDIIRIDIITITITTISITNSNRLTR